MHDFSRKYEALGIYGITYGCKTPFMDVCGCHDGLSPFPDPTLFFSVCISNITEERAVSVVRCRLGPYQ